MSGVTFVVKVIGGVHLPNKHRKQARSRRIADRMRFDALPPAIKLGIWTDAFVDHMASIGRDCLTQQCVFNPAIHGDLPIEDDNA